MWILWPSFIAAGMGVGILFSLIDPSELIVFGHPLHVDMLAAYSLGFFMLWAICAASSALSCFLQVTLGSDGEANRTARKGERPQ